MRMLQIDVHGIARSDEKMATLFFFSFGDLPKDCTHVIQSCDALNVGQSLQLCIPQASEC